MIRIGNTMEIRKAYDRTRTQTPIRGESLTSQAHKQECDINRIMQKWAKTGTVEHRNTFEGQYGNFTETPGDYHEAMNQVVQANEMFEGLPSGIRRRFGNDPGAFLDFVQDAKNYDQLIDMGLATKRPESAPDSLSERAMAKAPRTPPKGEKTASDEAENPL